MVKSQCSLVSRSHLMVCVLRKMTADILPAAQTLSQEHLIPAKTLPSDALARCLRTVFSQGWLDLTSLHTLEQILNLCGSDWLCDQLVRVSTCVKPNTVFWYWYREIHLLYNSIQRP